MAEMVALEQRQDRAAALRPIIGQVLQLLRQSAKKDGGIKIAVGPHTIELSSWERAQLAEAATDPAQMSDWSTVMLDAVAVQARGLNDLVRLRAVAENNQDQRERCLRDLMFDHALGIAVRTEAERLVLALGETGRRALAKNLAEFLQRFSHNIDVVKAALGESEVNTAETRASELTRAVAVPEEAASAASAARAEPGAATVAGPEAADRAGKKKKKGLTLKHMVAASLATVTLVVGAMVGIPLLTASYDVETGLKYVRGVKSWSGTPPLLVVTVSATEWNALEGSGQTAMVFAIAAAARKDGYSRAEVVTPDGKAVARWERATGVSRP